MLISFEGIDGCGKTTQIMLLHERLQREKMPVDVLREPGGTELSEMIRGILLNSDIPMNPVTELLLFSAARSELVSTRVKPLLDQKVIVILDRFYDSTVAYQGFGRGSLPINEINKLNKIAAHGLEPDVTFFLDIGVDEALERQNGTGKGPDRIERAGGAFFERVRDGYHYMSEQNGRYHTIDANRPAEDIHHEIWLRVSGMIR
ncbi:MAG: dTMP kinase [Balneolia bacterium]|nr:dTMP kinase [Balneolia bacterium]